MPNERATTEWASSWSSTEPYSITANAIPTRNAALPRPGISRAAAGPNTYASSSARTIEPGATIDLTTLLLAGDGDPVLDVAKLAKSPVKAEIVGHERGKKLRVFKFKPKRGYRRRTGHRQELTRLRITKIGK